MQTNENAEVRRNDSRGSRLNELRGVKFRVYEQTYHSSFQRVHLALFNQHPRIFASQQEPVQAVGNLATAAYEQHQTHVRAVAGQGAMDRSGMQYATESRSTYNQSAQLQQERLTVIPKDVEPQPTDPLAVARANVNAVTSDQSYVEPALNLGDDKGVEAYAEHGISTIEEYLRQIADSQERSETANA